MNVSKVWSINTSKLERLDFKEKSNIEAWLIDTWNIPAHYQLNSTQLNGGWDSLIFKFRHLPTHTGTCKSTTSNSMLAISLLLPTRFWPNFKDRFLGQSLTYFNCNNDICSGKFCPGDICPYEEYLSWYWPDFVQTLKVGSWDLL